jgi:hypothetical protein
VSHEQAVKHGPRPPSSAQTAARRNGEAPPHDGGEEASREGGGSLPAPGVAWLGFGGMRTKRERGGGK